MRIISGVSNRSWMTTMKKIVQSVIDDTIDSLDWAVDDRVDDDDDRSSDWKRGLVHFFVSPSTSRIE